MRPERGFAVALCAAVAASLGDLALLLVGTAPHFGRALPAPTVVLAGGGVLGVVGIPLYAVGYRAASSCIRARAPAGARVVRVAGLLAALIGAAIHAATALTIARQLAAGPSAAATPDPLAAVAQSPALVALWVAAGVCFTAASAPLAWRGLRGPERWTLANPIVLTLAFSVLGAGFELGRWLLAPAAPNLAHAAFFALGRARARRAAR